MGQPLYFANPATSGQASFLSAMPSLSLSGQPFNAAGPAWSGQASKLSAIPSPSRSFGGSITGIATALGASTFFFARLGHRKLNYDINETQHFPLSLLGIEN